MSVRPAGVPPEARAIPQRGYTIYLVGDDRRPLLRDAYHTFLRVPWAASLGFIAVAFLVVNLVFALVYLAVGGLAGARDGSLVDAFTFSAQTLSTIGYGVEYPKSGGANSVMIAEAITSIIFTALATGLLFAKFSRPTVRIAFSSTAIITPHDGKPTLMFRVGNRRGNVILDPQIRVVVSRLIRTAEGDPFYKMFDVPLVRDRQIGLKRGWTVMHVIDEASPFHGLDSAALAKAEAEIAISLAGTDDISMQAVTVTHEYADTEIQFDMRFADTLTPLPNGDLVFDQGKFDVTIPIEPRASVPA